MKINSKITADMAEVTRQFLEEEGGQLDLVPCQMGDDSFYVGLHDCEGTELASVSFEQRVEATAFIKGLLDTIDKKRLSKFMTGRRMFVVDHEGTTLIAPANIDRDHLQWFEFMGWRAGEALRLATRGYVNELGVFGYSGSDFRIDHMVRNETIQALPYLKAEMDLRNSLPVHVGLKPDRDKYDLDGNEFLGTIGDLLCLNQ